MEKEKLNELRPGWAEIDLDAIAYNIRKTKELLKPETNVMAVVKCRAYGHGAVEIAYTAVDNGVDCLGVAFLEEAKELRKAGIESPIYTFGPMYKSQIPDYVEYNIIPFITRVEMAEALSAYGEKVNKAVDIHVKLDTGMGRLGFLPGEAVEKVIEIARLPYVNIGGVCSHLPQAYGEGKEAREFTKKQIAKFKELVEKIEKAGVEIPIKHLANSAGILEYPESHLDMVRPGIMIYGLWPYVKRKAKRLSNELNIKLKQALQLKAEIAYTKTLPANHGISYGSEYITSESTRIGIIPLGYGDGYSRFLTHKGEVLINNKKARILGVMCMDQLMVDLRDVPEAKAGTEVVLIGKDELTVDEIANEIGSINYEIISRIGSRVPRVYVQEGEIVKVKAVEEKEVI